MRRADINRALKDRLASGGVGLNNTWPNVAPVVPTERPYLEVLFPAADRAGQSLRGTLTRETGTMAVVVVVEFGAGGGEDEANEYAEKISDLFPMSLRLPIPGGSLMIAQPADIRGGYKDGPDWRVPVMIRYSALNR